MSSLCVTVQIVTRCMISSATVDIVFQGDFAATDSYNVQMPLMNAAAVQVVLCNTHGTERVVLALPRGIVQNNCDKCICEYDKLSLLQTVSYLK